MRRASWLVLGAWCAAIASCGEEGGAQGDEVSGAIEIAAGAAATANREVEVTLASDRAVSVTLGEAVDLSDGKTLAFTKTLSWELY